MELAELPTLVPLVGVVLAAGELPLTPAEVAAGEPEPVELVALVVPSTPPEPALVSPGAMLAVALVAKVEKAERDLAEALLELMAATIPFWQWSAWAQYSQMGVVLLTMMVYVASMVAPSAVGMKPDHSGLVTLDSTLAIGMHGLAKVDCATEWFFG